MKIARSRYQAIAASLAITEHSPRNRSLCSAAAGIHGTLQDGRLPGTRSSPEGKPSARLSRPVGECGRKRGRIRSPAIYRYLTVPSN